MAARQAHAVTAGGDRAWHAIQRLLLPEDEQRMPLYARGGTRTSRTALRLAEGEKASYATYFGGLPVAYWRAHTTVRSLRLVGEVQGSGCIDVRRTDADGAVGTLVSRQVHGRFAIEVPVDDVAAWLWCEVVATDGEAIVEGLCWETADQPVTTARITVAITTFDREADCVRLLGRLASDEVADRIGAVVVADQGTRRLAAADGYARVAADLGGSLRLFEQPNLGGSGGFSRGMIEALGDDGTHVLLLDDDVDLEPESLARLAAFAEHAGRELIVGAQMLSLIAPTVLHSYGERVDRRTMWWQAVEPELSQLDLAVATIEHTAALSRRIDVDFNGWWMCLVPVPLVRRIGASLPLFIKWDDAEFGLRAAAHGVPTVTLPGAALWHMPWTAKDDGLDWQAYFQLRNRLVTALLHGGRGVLRASFAQDVNHIICSQYGSAAVRNLALRDVLSGPRHLDVVLQRGPQRPAQVLREYGQVVVADPPAARRVSPQSPSGVAARVRRAVRVLAHQLRPATTRDAAPVVLSRERGKWWSLGLIDDVVLETAAGAGAFVLRRDRAVAVRLLAEAVRLRWRLWWRWRGISARYVGAAAQAASPAAWAARFEGVAPQR